MAVISKKNLRRLLAQRYVHDMPLFDPKVSTLTNGSGTSPVSVYHMAYADTNNSGQNLYQNAWLYLEGSTQTPNTAATMYQYNIGSYNFGSGAFITGAFAQDNHNPNSVFELHTRVAPEDKDNAIDETIQRIRLRQQVTIPTIDGALFYTLDGCASPFTLDRILAVHLFANPSGSLDRDQRAVVDWEQVVTASGTNELWMQQGVQGSQQLVFDAILIPSLNSELSTITVPDERWILAGAAAKCYDFMIQAAPAQQVAILTQRRTEWAQEFSRLCTRFQPTFDHAVKMHDTVRGKGTKAYDQGWFGY